MLLAGICRLSASSVVVCNAADCQFCGWTAAAGPAAVHVDGWEGRHCTAGQYGYVPLGQQLFIIIIRIKIVVAVGSFVGQILDYEDNGERRASDVERLVSELDSRLCLETNSSDDGDGDDGDDDDENDVTLPSQVQL